MRAVKLAAMVGVVVFGMAGCVAHESLEVERHDHDDRGEHHDQGHDKDQGHDHDQGHDKDQGHDHDQGH